MRIVFAGTPATAVPALEALVASTHQVVGVVTRPDARAGRGRAVVASPVKEAALAHGIPVLTPASPRDEAFQDALRAIAPDVCAVVAYGALLPQAVLDIPPHGWVNLHFSLLPAWRGAAPVQRALMAGDEVTGASTFLLEAGLDTGPVFGMMTEVIRPDDTAGTLLDRLADGGAGLLVATVDGIADGSLLPVPQAVDDVSYAPKLTPAEAEVPWTAPAFAVDRQVRGCTPSPGAWTTFRGERVKIGPVRMPSGPVEMLAPGRLLVAKQSVLVGTATHPVVLAQVGPTGKRHMAAADWARGVRIGDGEGFDG